MKGLLFAVVAATGLSGCVLPTKQPLDSEVAPTPSDRLLAYQDRDEGFATIVVTRDIGMIGGGCQLGVVINDKLAGKLNTGERAHFYVPPGEHLLAPTWIDGRGLCGAFYSEDRAAARRRFIEVSVASGATKRYRIHTNTDGESTIEPAI